MLHKTHTVGIVLVLIFITSCYGPIHMPNKKVALLPKTGIQYTGDLFYNKDGYGGVIIIEHGPGNEKFTGEYVVIDRTASAQQQSALVIPQQGQLPAVGTAGGVASGTIDAFGIWYATGDRGSRMDCKLQIGKAGYGHGICKHSDGSEYEILLYSK